MTSKQALEILNNQVGYSVELVQEAYNQLNMLVEFEDAIKRNYSPYLFAKKMKRKKIFRCRIYINEKTTDISEQDYNVIVGYMTK